MWRHRQCLSKCSDWRKAHAEASKEVVHVQGFIVEIIRSLNGISASSKSFSLCLGVIFLGKLWHIPSRVDLLMQVRTGSTYGGKSCTSTHVDNFLIMGACTELIIEVFKTKFVKRNSEINPASCLGYHWKISYLGTCKIHNEKWIKEAMHQLQNELGTQLKKESDPVNPKHHPELKETRLLVNQKITEH